MNRSTLAVLTLAVALTACGDHPPSSASLPEESQEERLTEPRERLAARLAVAMKDPTLRQEIANRFANSRAPEGKLQFQALMHAEGDRLIAKLATAGGGSLGGLLGDLDAARSLELYIPVSSHREGWRGEAKFLVATLESDGERPVAFDSDGNRTLLSAASPPKTPVLALVPQEHDFTDGRPSLMMTCIDGCDADLGGSDGGGPAPAAALQPGLYLSETHFDEDHESWLKGSPEFEFHVYGEVDGESKQLSCTGEHANGSYRWRTDALDWTGEAALLTEQDITQYLSQNPSGVIRIVAWEDDHEMCVPRTSGSMLSDILTNLDEVYDKWTAASISPWLVTGAQKAYAAWGLARAVHNWIATEDDLIGFGIEGSIAGWPAGGSNFALKGRNVVTTGSFGTSYRR